jgi:hypothetical protein
VDVKNDLQSVRLETGDDRRVDALVRVRGIDARANGRGFLYERHHPVALLVDEHGRQRRVEFPAEGGIHPAFYVAPVAAYLAVRMVLRRRSGT